MIKELQIEELRIGHYVIEIVEQIEHYSLTGAGNIKSDLVIKNLIAKGVKSVLIDTDKSISEKLATSEEISRPVIREVHKAKAIFDQSKKIQEKIFEDALLGRPIDLAPVTEITDKAIDEIFKNSDALACVINIRDKDAYLLEHSVSVSVLMTIFAKYLKVEKDIIQQLAVGAFLHDVGKIMIPEEILNKPGKLTDKEFETMKTHVNHSIDVIQHTSGISELSLEVAALHHEKLNGEGYPFNIPGDHISTYGRMISICDIFDALTANRCYKEGYSHTKAFAILRNLAEKEHLDMRLVGLFIKCMGVYPVGSLVELSSNKIAIVEERNTEDPTKPKVKSFYSAKHQHYLMAKDIDLSKANDTIVKSVRADDLDLDMNKIIEFLLMEG